MNPIDWITVASSNLHSVAYDNEAGELRVRFQKGGAVTADWAYPGVPVTVYESLLAATSKGGYFAASIKPVYPGRRVS